MPDWSAVAEDAEQSYSVEEHKERFTEEELGRLARGGDNKAQTALVDLMREERGETEMREILRDSDMWNEEPEKAASLVMEKQREWEQADREEAAYDFQVEDVLETLIEKGNAEAVAKYVQTTGAKEEANQKFQGTYEEKLEEGEELEAARLAQVFGDSKKAKKAANEYLSNYTWEHRDDKVEAEDVDTYNAEKVAEAAEIAGRADADKALNESYQEAMDQSSYSEAATLAKAARGRDVSIGRKEELKAAKKVVEEKVEEDSYREAIEIAREHELGGEYVQDVLTKARLNVEDLDQETYKELSQEFEGYQNPSDASTKSGPSEGALSKIRGIFG